MLSLAEAGMERVSLSFSCLGLTLVKVGMGGMDGTRIVEGSTSATEVEMVWSNKETSSGIRARMVGVSSLLMIAELCDMICWS